MTSKCRVCSSHIYTMAFRGTGVCSELCRKTLMNCNSAIEVRDISLHTHGLGPVEAVTSNGQR